MKLIFFLFLLGVSSFRLVSAAEMINVECEYLSVGKPIILTDFFIPDKKTQWYQFWLDSPKVRFYIDLTRSTAINSNGLGFDVDRRGDRIILNKYDYYTASLTHKFILDRLNGDFSGMIYAYGNSFLPEFKEGEIMELFEGRCERLDLKF